MNSKQLLIECRPQANYVFDSFVKDGNEDIVGRLQSLCVAAAGPSDPVYLFGADACGKSHLLQAVCHCAIKAGRHAIYLPMETALKYGADLVDGLEAMDVVCLDGVDAIAGRMAWEECLLNLINRIRSVNGGFVAAAKDGPRNLAFVLPDLSSRLVWGGVYRLVTLPDEAKSRAVQLRARLKGHELPAEVVAWLLAHCSRDMHDLMEAVGKLGEASILERRRITVPFARTVMSGEQAVSD